MRRPRGAFGFLYHRPTQRVLLHHRSHDAPLNPNRWGLFGGSEEEADGGDLVTTWRRELREELGVEPAPDQVVPLWNYVTARGNHRSVFYCSWASADDQFILGEGQAFAWFTIDEALRALDVTESTRRDFERLRDHLAASGATPPV